MVGWTGLEEEREHLLGMLLETAKYHILLIGYRPQPVGHKSLASYLCRKEHIIYAVAMKSRLHRPKVHIMPCAPPMQSHHVIM